MYMSLGPRAFCSSGPASWNSLPAHLRDPVLSLNVFRERLKTVLFALCLLFRTVVTAGAFVTFFINCASLKCLFIIIIIFLYPRYYYYYYYYFITCLAPSYLADICTPVCPSSAGGSCGQRTVAHSLCLVGPSSAGVTLWCPGQRHGTDSQLNCRPRRFPLTHSQKSSKLICLAESTSGE